MKDLIEKILAYIPEYLMNFGKLLTRPKTFLGKTRPGTKNGFQSGLQFLAITMVLVVMSLTPLSAQGSEIWTTLVFNSLYEILAVAAMAGTTRLAWLMVGGQAKTQSLVTLYCYITSVMLVLFALTLIITYGTVRFFNPALYAALRQAPGQQPIPVQFSNVDLVAAGFFICGLVSLSVWFVASWGAFRALNNTTRGRSLVAFILANVLATPVTVVLLAFAWAFSPVTK